jgi:hypothetical protein
MKRSKNHEEIERIVKRWENLTRVLFEVMGFGRFMERRRRRKKEERKEGSCSGILMMLLNVA